MSVYLQFDSSSRSSPYILKDLGSGLVYVPNDKYNNEPPAPLNYQLNSRDVQTPTNYRVYYKELNSPNNQRTLSFLAHCRERPVNLTYSVENCVVTVPSSATVIRKDESGNISYESILNEPYIYVRIAPINHSEGNLIYSNNPAVDPATFIVWCDKNLFGVEEPSPVDNILERPNEKIIPNTTYTPKWVIYNTCMITVMRLDLKAEEWQIRLYDRYGNDIVLAENDNGGTGYTTEPNVDPDLQTMVLVGIRPNLTFQ